MKFSITSTLVALAAASQVSASISPLLAGPEPYSSVDAEKANAQINRSQSGKLSVNPASQTNIVPNLYIVEFDDNAQVKLADPATKRALADEHEAFHAHMKRAKSSKTKKAPKYKTRYEWKNAQLFKGLSVKLEHEDDVAFLKTAPGVKTVTPARYYTHPAYKAVVASKEFAMAAGQSGTNVQPLQSRAATYDLRNDTFSPHVMTGVDKLHAKGYYGKGMTVGVFDTGIDYTHPALNSGKPAGTACFGAGCQIVGGRDFVGDAYTGDNTPVPDNDPFADCQGSGHGTHVTGTIVARPSAENTFTGVVPEASAKMYRIFGCGEGATVSNDVIIQSLTFAYFDGVDVMSLSLGGAGGWQEDPASAVASRISHLGIPVVFANGNDGSEGAFYGSSPAAGKAVTAVGSVDNVQLTGYSVYTVGATGGDKALTLLTASAWNFTGTLPVKPVSLDPNVLDDGCDAAKVAAAGPFDGTVALVGRGTCTFVTKLDNLYNNGARYIIVYNTPYPASNTYVESNHNDLLVASLTRADGLYIKAQVAAGTPIKLDFSKQKIITTPDTNTGGLMSSFSTTTPFWELSFGAQISAPGGNILSTWPLKLGRFSIISGTSMATPFVAGSIAMYYSINGKSESVTTIRGILADTAKPVNVAGKTANVTGPIDTVVKQGGGLIDTYKAVFHTSRASPNLLALNDTRFFAGKQTITVSNVGKNAQTYKISHAPAGTLSTVNTQTTFFNIFPVPISTAGQATASFSTKSLTVPPGQSRSFDVTFTPPAAVDQTTVPVYSGYIKLDSQQSPMRGSLSIPYAGVQADTYKQKILDTTSNAAGVPLPALLDPAGNVITNDTSSYTLGDNGADAPSLAFRVRWGTAIESIDLVYANTTFKPSIPISDPAPDTRRRRHHEESNMVRSRRHHNLAQAQNQQARHAIEDRAPAPIVSNAGVKYRDVETIGNVYQGQWVPRDGAAALPSITLTSPLSVANGTATVPVQDGTYRLLLRVHKQFHEYDLESSYESYLSHAFTIKTTQA